MQLVILRHGDTKWNNQGLLMGHTDIGLCDKGEKNSRLISEKIKAIRFEIAFTSNLIRTIQTTMIILKQIAPEKIPVICDVGSDPDSMLTMKHNNLFPIYKTNHFCERHFGILEGESRKQNIFQIHDWNLKIPGAESLEEVSARVKQGYKRFCIPQINQEKNVLIVAHGICIKLLISHIERQNPQIMLNYKLKNCSGVIYEMNSSAKIISKDILSI